MYCRYTVKMPLDIVLADLEQSLEKGAGQPLDETRPLGDTITTEARTTCSLERRTRS